MDIAALSTREWAATAVADTRQALVLKKAFESQQQLALGLIEALPPSARICLDTWGKTSILRSKQEFSGLSKGVMNFLISPLVFFIALLGTNVHC